MPMLDPSPERATATARLLSTFFEFIEKAVASYCRRTGKRSDDVGGSPEALA